MNEEFGYGIGIISEKSRTCMCCKKKIKKGQHFLSILKANNDYMSLFYKPETMKDTDIHLGCLFKRIKESNPKALSEMVAESI